MTAFPRGAGAMPRLITPPRFSNALSSWSQSGKGQQRATINMGRVWSETYPTLDMNNANVRALMQALNQSLREGTQWTVQHPYWQVRKGVGGGTPRVNGSGQSGNTLLINSGPTNVTNWLRRGDIISVPGCSVVFDVAGDVNTDSGGNASIPIQPPIFIGSGPSDAVLIEIVPANIQFTVIVADVSDFPAQDVTRYIDAGMVVTFREQPQ